MKSTRAVLALLSVHLLCFSRTESRKDPAGEYWRSVMKDEPMPKAIAGLIMLSNSDHSTPKIPKEKTKCSDHKSTLNSFTEDFEPVPHVTSYPDNEAKLSVKPLFTKDFEPEPQATAYPNDDVESSVKQLFARDFEAEPQMTAYPSDDVESSVKKLFTKDFKPSMGDVTAYHGNTNRPNAHQNSFAEDFEPTPHVTNYNE
ncbi:organ-specific protein P4-like [Humulus lupulus]|uniref:organ-specific protein P4-like n=1 Tax=Humulus lupulus TaxID=3486 RepID=UPI002B4164B4|nr:organ-specific protein P4-like [Humulus lupulus]